MERVEDEHLPPREDVRLATPVMRTFQQARADMARRNKLLRNLPTADMAGRNRVRLPGTMRWAPSYHRTQHWRHGRLGSRLAAGLARVDRTLLASVRTFKYVSSLPTERLTSVSFQRSS